MRGPLTQSELTAIEAAVLARQDGYLADLRELVDIDCGSYTKTGVDVAGRWVTDRLTSLGAHVTAHRHAELGDTVVADFDSGAPGPTLMLIGHLDTVFEVGTAAERPFSTRGDRAYGPGVSDMKSGLLSGLHAIASLQEVTGSNRWPSAGRLVFVANPDEEIGSPTSTPIIKELAQEADVALILESARANGALVTARKGMLSLRLSLAGQAAHAGVEPEKGRSAVLEAAHKTVALHALNGHWNGVTVNVGVINGGTRPNIVAPGAALAVDIRASRAADLVEVEAAARAIAQTSTVDGVTATVEVTMRWAPMEPSGASAGLTSLAIDLGADLGLDVGTAQTGGASDGNTTAAMGVPTLDGLGPVGGGAHSPDEYLDLESVVPRTTLLAALLSALGDGGQKKT
jgi:glutamate carboxypeptidase